MKAISLWQPWASLIACGAKPFETRSWAPPRALIGQTIAIHAAKKIDKSAAGFAEELCYGQYEPGGFELADKIEATMSEATDDMVGLFGKATLPIGCVVAMAKLTGAYRLIGSPVGLACAPSMTIAETLGAPLTPKLAGLSFDFHPDDEPMLTLPVDGFGDYAEGRWAWLLTDVKPLNPPPRAKGAQGFFELPQGWLT